MTTSNRSWFSIKTDQEVDGNPIAPEIMVYDEIGAWGIGAAEFDKALKALGDVKQITMRINSPGGDSFAGIAIYNILANHPADITARVDGIAASAASLIAMAADKIVMPKNAFMVVHEPHALTIGPAEAHLAMAADLERVASSYANTYAARSKQSLEDVKTLMKEDRLMSAEECKAKGYCDETAEPMTVNATFDLEKLPKKFRAVAASIYTAANSDEAQKLIAKEKDRVDTIREIGVQAKCDQAFIDAAIASGTSKKDFRKVLLAKLIDDQTQEIDVTTVTTTYGQAEIDQTLELCAVAKVPSAEAQKFISAKTPLVEVSKQLLASRATESDRLKVDASGNQIISGLEGEAISTEARMASWKETQAKIKRELGIGKRKAA